MISQRSQFLVRTNGALGTVGHLVIFACSLALVMLAPAARLPWAAGICLAAALLLYPQVFRRLLKLRFLVMLLVLAVPPVFLIGEPDRSLAGIAYSSEGLQSGLQVSIRILVVLMAVGGLTGSVDIASVAGLLERLGLQGLGFSMGVALNLLPALQQSALNAWRSLWMRGGLRRKRRRGLRLLAVTVIAGALSRAEEIALAAEARAFSPERARALPVKSGRLDWVVAVAGVVLVLVVILAP